MGALQTERRYQTSPIRKWYKGAIIGGSQVVCLLEPCAAAGSFVASSPRDRISRAHHAPQSAQLRLIAQLRSVQFITNLLYCGTNPAMQPVFSCTMCCTQKVLSFCTHDFSVTSLSTSGNDRMNASRLLLTSLLSFVGLTFAQPGLAQNAGKLAQIRDAKTLVIGHRPDFAPFSYVVDGSLRGYGVDVCQKIVRALEQQLQTPLEIKYKPVNNQQRFDAVAKGEIDLECADTTNTRERREKYGVDFLAPYFITGVQVLVRKDSGITSTSQLQGKKLAYTAGTTSEEVAKKYSATWGVSVSGCGPLDGDCMRDLAEKKVDAWMMDDIALQATRAASKNPEDYILIGGLLSVEHLAIMYKAGDAEFSKTLNSIMNRLMRSREIRQSYATWFERPFAPLNTNLQMPPSNLLLNYMRHPSPEVGEYVVY
ncbi:MAG: amino acid ABC transporter substrate-binding protein [Brachymonas sp.]|nr:amino acid ABC transporter substrate-binding protein [Brachymonas sp.]